ncbi:DUF4817 domain-containing protein [Trichonephila clavata]|uniref:DUF4817 domain-containing protein n=1 Tax=Trichonephila clavata TaxID=2740835 RepID=A0A8X6GAU5_TRICU|nr:DUF4817 domain-containing protein [Trichonephila clavata]
MFSQEQIIAIGKFYFATKSHSRVINAFRQKYPGETAPNASKITLLVQRFRAAGSVAGRKRSDRSSLVKMKVTDVETALQRSPMKISRKLTVQLGMSQSTAWRAELELTFDRLKYTL